MCIYADYFKIYIYVLLCNIPLRNFTLILYKARLHINYAPYANFENCWIAKLLSIQHSCKVLYITEIGLNINKWKLSFQHVSSRIRCLMCRICDCCEHYQFYLSLRDSSKYCIQNVSKACMGNLQLLNRRILPLCKKGVYKPIK